MKTDFSMETLKTWKAWSDVFHVLKDSESHPKIIHPAKIYDMTKG